MTAGKTATIAALVACFCALQCGGQSELEPEGGAAGNAGSGGTGGSGGADFCSEDPASTVSMPLDAFCRYFTCSASLDEAVADEQALCTDTYYGATLVEGCGLSALGGDGVFGGRWEVFDSETGELVGASLYNDEAFGPCGAAGYQAGVELADCGETVSCAMCLTVQSIPRCRFDCDCEALDPVIDPCFGGDSCQCYCSMLDATSGH